MYEKEIAASPGNWVDGTKFWDRETEIALITGKIDEGAHILLVAQRRMGKTSLLHEVARRLTEAGRYICLFIDFQGAASAEDAIVKLSLSTKPHASLWGKTKGVFANALGAIKGTIDTINLGEVGVKLRAGLTAGDWRAKGDHAELTHYEERLRLVLGEEDFILALDMLTETAVTGILGRDGLEQLRWDAAARLMTQGITRDLVVAQKEILWVLEHDGYLRKTEHGYVFVSNLLRD